MGEEEIQRKLEETEKRIIDLEKTLSVATTMTPEDSVEDRALFIRVEGYERKLSELYSEAARYRRELK